MSSSPVNYNLQNLFGQQGPQNLFGFGSNQYGGGWPMYNYPSPTSYQVPSKGPYSAQTPGLQSGPGGYYVGSSYDPQLTSSLFGYLGGQIGQGLPTYPGELTAPPNQLYGQLGSLLTGGQSNLPYGQQMLQMAQTGDPTDVGPAWKAMIAASQQNIAENQAQLKEQYAAGGNLVGTPYGSAMSDYMSQTALGENAILTQAQQQAAEAAAGRQAGMQQYLTGADLNLGGQLQNISQLGATNAYNEWLRTQPQYNPLLGQAFGGATTFPPYLNPQQSPWAMLIPAILNSINIPGISKNPQTPPISPPGPGGQTPPGPGGGGKGGGGQNPPAPVYSQQTYDPGNPQNAMNNLISQYLGQYLQGGSNPQSVEWQNLINALGAPGNPDITGAATAGGATSPNIYGGTTNTPMGSDLPQEIPPQPYYPSNVYDPYGGGSSYYDSGGGSYGDAAGGMLMNMY